MDASLGSSLGADHFSTYLKDSLDSFKAPSRSCKALIFQKAQKRAAFATRYDEAFRCVGTLGTSNNVPNVISYAKEAFLACWFALRPGHVCQHSDDVHSLLFAASTSMFMINQVIVCVHKHILRVSTGAEGVSEPKMSR